MSLRGAESGGRCRGGLLEVLMDEGDRHAAFADSGSDAFHRGRAHVAAGEDAGDARLEKVRVALELPASGGGDVRTGEDIAAPVELDLRWQPRRLRIGADEQEEPAGLQSRRLSRVGVTDIDRLESCLAVSGNDFRPEPGLDVRTGRELLDQVARHAPLEPLAAAQD